MIGKGLSIESRGEEVPGLGTGAAGGMASGAEGPGVEPAGASCSWVADPSTEIVLEAIEEAPLSSVARSETV
jgi:hypothetical protein